MKIKRVSSLNVFITKSFSPKPDVQLTRIYIASTATVSVTTGAEMNESERHVVVAAV